jgi:hypothetical protein
MMSVFWFWTSVSIWRWKFTTPVCCAAASR